MLWWLFLLFRGDEFFLLLLAILLFMRSNPDEMPTDPVDSTFIEDVDFMFPENFLARYPHEANPFRFKIFSYLIFNLLVKGYGSVDPSSFWSNYNRDDFYRTAIDAAFYEYLTNFTDKEAKNLVFNPLDDIRSNLEKPMSNEEIAVDRIGQYLDLLAENKFKPEIIKGAYSILSKATESPTISKHQIPECDMHTPIHTSGAPGIDYPNFCDIPKTSFTCVGKTIPGIYADYEAGCQVFHVCWRSRQDIFLCPIGTIFNQSLLTCDIWHDTGCFSSPIFHRDQFLVDGISTKSDVPEWDSNCENLLNKPLRAHTKFLPAKCEVRDIRGRKVRPRPKEEVDEIRERLVETNDLIEEMINMLVRLSELNDERTSRGNARIKVLAKHLNSIQNLSTETVEEVTEFARQLDGTDFKPQNGVERGEFLDDFQLELKPSIFVTNKLSEEHLRSTRKQEVPEMVMGSLRLGGTILNEGVLPLAKQVIIDSYRKIEPKNR